MRRRPTANLLAAEQRRDADTWGVHLLDAAQQGLNPDYTIADAGQGVRAGQKAAWDDTPCHGDVFHIQHQCEGLANTLARFAEGATSRRQTLQAKTGHAGQRGPDNEFAAQLALARQAEAQAHELARDIWTLTQWLRHDVLALAGPALATRQALFDFIVEELMLREPRDVRRIRAVRVALQNQRDAARWWRTSTRGCAPTSPCAAISAAHTWTCCGSSSTTAASCAADPPSARARARAN